MRISKFEPGRSTYTCHICGKKTRDTGCGEYSCNLCLKCYEMCSMENDHVDGYHKGIYVEGCPYCKEEMDEEYKMDIGHALYKSRR